MEISIAEVARLTGTTSRTLRHYDDVGLLPPSSVGANGMRYYDQVALIRLQRILLLRQLGVGLPAIADALSNRVDDSEALTAHLRWLKAERQRLAKQIAAVEKTVAALREGSPLMAEEMLDGFDHTVHRDEVEQRWGKEAYARSDAWWRRLGQDGQQAFRAESKAIQEAWQAAYNGALPVDGEEVRALVVRHVAWITAGWGGVQPTNEQLLGLAEMYVADDRFAENYGGTAGAGYVRDAMAAYVATRQ